MRLGHWVAGGVGAAMAFTVVALYAAGNNGSDLPQFFKQASSPIHIHGGTTAKQATRMPGPFSTGGSKDPKFVCSPGKSLPCRAKKVDTSVITIGTQRYSPSAVWVLRLLTSDGNGWTIIADGQKVTVLASTSKEDMDMNSQPDSGNLIFHRKDNADPSYFVLNSVELTGQPKPIPCDKCDVTIGTSK